MIVSNVGLNQAQLDAILLEGIYDSQTRNAIIKAITENNNAIERYIKQKESTGLDKAMQDFRRKR